MSVNKASSSRYESENRDIVFDTPSTGSPFGYGHGGSTSAIATWESNPDVLRKRAFIKHDFNLEICKISLGKDRNPKIEQGPYRIPKERLDRWMKYYQTKINFLFPLISKPLLDECVSRYPVTNSSQPDKMNVTISPKPNEMSAGNHAMMLAALALAWISFATDELFVLDVENTEGSALFEAAHQISLHFPPAKLTLAKMNILFALFWNKAGNISKARAFIWKACYNVEMLNNNPKYHNPEEQEWKSFWTVYWICIELESELLIEDAFPQSNLQQWVESAPLPVSAINPIEMQFLMERIQILKVVRQALPPHNEDLAARVKTVQTAERNLLNIHELPRSHLFANRLQELLSHAKIVIYRPSLLYILEQKEKMPEVMEHCEYAQKCLHNIHKSLRLSETEGSKIMVNMWAYIIRQSGYVTMLIRACHHTPCNEYQLRCYASTSLKLIQDLSRPKDADSYLIRKVTNQLLHEIAKQAWGNSIIPLFGGIEGVVGCK